MALALAMAMAMAMARSNFTSNPPVLVIYSCFMTDYL